jgi:hypothetical protein
MAQKVSRQPVTAESLVSARVSHVVFLKDKLPLGQVFLLSSSVSPYQYHSTKALRAHVTWGWTTCPLVAAVQTILSPSTWTTVNLGYQLLFIWVRNLFSRPKEITQIQSVCTYERGSKEDWENCTMWNSATCNHYPLLEWSNHGTSAGRNMWKKGVCEMHTTFCQKKSHAS